MRQMRGNGCEVATERPFCIAFSTELASIAISIPHSGEHLTSPFKLSM